MNYLADTKRSADAVRDYHYNTVGVFVHNTWTVSEKFTLETGLRGDYVKDYSFELLPA